MNLINKLRLFNNLLNSNSSHNRQQEDIYSLQLLQNIMTEGNFIPFTAMSLRPYVLAFLLNEMIINNRKKVIEFGAGISTIMLARSAKMLNNGAKIVTVEENSSWCKLIEKMLRDEALLEYVTLINVSLEKKELLGNSSHWYHADQLKVALHQQGAFDLVMIDGPTACNREIAQSRYFAVPFLKDLLEKDHAIFLDDANRNGEKKIMQMWNEECGKKFSIYAETLGVYYQGEHFESNPMKYIPIQ